jgi:hypothetical protein
MKISTKNSDVSLHFGGTSSQMKYLIIKKTSKVTPTWGRCYDQNFLQFLPIFCEKIGVFSKSNVMINFFQKLAVV